VIDAPAQVRVAAPGATVGQYNIVTNMMVFIRTCLFSGME